jgi:hypothetical protein
MSSGDFWLPWINLAVLNRSSFALTVFCVQVRNCFLFPVMSMRVGLSTGILRLRALMDGILF